MAFKDGDFVEIEYSAWRVVDNALLSTTEEKRARDGGIYEEGMRYGPVLVILGAKSIVKGLDREIRGLEVGDAKSFTLKPQDAFGERNEELVRVLPVSNFRDNDINPKPGMRVNIDNVTVTVRSVTSGRVTVDANPPEAGQEIKYELRVVSRVDSTADKVKSLGRTFNVEPTAVALGNRILTVSFDDKVKKNYNYFVGRANLLAAVFTYINDLDRIEVREDYDRPKEDKTERDG